MEPGAPSVLPNPPERSTAASHLRESLLGAAGIPSHPMICCSRTQLERWGKQGSRWSIIPSLRERFVYSFWPAAPNLISSPRINFYTIIPQSVIITPLKKKKKNEETGGLGLKTSNLQETQLCAHH